MKKQFEKIKDALIQGYTIFVISNKFYGEGMEVKANASPSNNPLSLSFTCGITNRAIKESVINGADNGLPRLLAMASMAV